MSELVRGTVEAELRRRAEARELEKKRQASGTGSRWDELLERARG